MRLALFQVGGTGEVLPGLLTDRGVVSVADMVKKSYTPQLTMNGIIDDFASLKPRLEELQRTGKALAIDQVRLVRHKGTLPHFFKHIHSSSGKIGSYTGHHRRGIEKKAAVVSFQLLDYECCKVQQVAGRRSVVYEALMPGRHTHTV